jgi:hypothetical protein
MPRAVRLLKFPVLTLALMLACALLFTALICAVAGQGHSTRQLSKWLSAASSTSVSQLTTRAFDLGTDGVVALESPTQISPSTPFSQALEVKFLLIQWGALLYRTPVIGWIHRVQKLEDGWRTGGLSRWLSLLDFALETALLFMSKFTGRFTDRFTDKWGARGLKNNFNLFYVSSSPIFVQLFHSSCPVPTSRQVFLTLSPSHLPTLPFSRLTRLAHPLRPF